MKPILITSGEPAGIGPDLCVSLSSFEFPFLVLGDEGLLHARADMLGLKPLPSARIWHVPLSDAVTCGQLNLKNSGYVLEMLRLAGESCLVGEAAAVVTAPVHKAILNTAGTSFTGHTEFFAQLAGVEEVVMLLVCESMKVALVTTHLPLSAVPAAITPKRLATVIRIVEQGMRELFHYPEPRLLVTGLNPHAGEDGYLGREEIDIMMPVIHRFQQQDFKIQGPFPADTAFTPQVLNQADVVITMYHDQGLPVLKYAGFGEAVNVTLGLPFVRTSVDHGTALSLAGTGKADGGSLTAAVRLAGYATRLNV